MRRLPALSRRALNAITGVFIKEAKIVPTHRREESVSTEAETGVMRLQTKECQQPSDTG